MPPLDKSGLNMRGAVFSSSFKPSPAEATQGGLERHEKLDYVLYNAFYKMQEAMGQSGAPGKHFSNFSSCVDVVLSAIESCTAAPRVDVAEAPLAVTFFRDPEVFLAQFSPEFDPRGQFKLQILVQLAIYLNYLETQPSKMNALMQKEAEWVKATRARVTADVQRLWSSNSWLEDILHQDTMWYDGRCGFSFSRSLAL